MKNRAFNTTDPSTAAAAAPICWQRETSATCLRIELPSGEAHLFPYSHFITARFARTAENVETLHLTFSTHEIQLEGHALRDLLHGIQDFAIKWLRPIPERYQPLVVSQSGVITSILVTTAA